jgi:hypothetical protein
VDGLTNKIDAMAKQTDRMRNDEWMKEQIDKLTKQWMDEQSNGQIDGSDRHMNLQTDRLMKLMDGGARK